MNLENVIGFTSQSPEMRQIYRNVFTSPEGMIVLRDILTHCGYFNSIDPEDRDSLIMKRFAEELVLNLMAVNRGEENVIELDEVRGKQLEAQIKVLTSIKFKKNEEEE